MSENLWATSLTLFSHFSRFPIGSAAISDRIPHRWSTSEWKLHLFSGRAFNSSEFSPFLFFLRSVKKSDTSFNRNLAGVRLMSIEDRTSSILLDTCICQRTQLYLSQRQIWQILQPVASICVSLFVFVFSFVFVSVSVEIGEGYKSQFKTGSLPAIIPHQHCSPASSNSTKPFYENEES